MRKYIKLNEVLAGIIIILLSTTIGLATYIFTKEEIPQVPTEIKEIVKIETINITKIIKEEVIDVDGCLYARTPGHIKQCLDKYG